MRDLGFLGGPLGYDPV